MLTSNLWDEPIDQIAARAFTLKKTQLQLLMLSANRGGDFEAWAPYASETSVVDPDPAEMRDMGQQVRRLRPAPNAVTASFYDPSKGLVPEPFARYFDAVSLMGGMLSSYWSSMAAAHFLFQYLHAVLADAEWSTVVCDLVDSETLCSLLERRGRDSKDRRQRVFETGRGRWSIRMDAKDFKRLRAAGGRLSHVPYEIVRVSSSKALSSRSFKCDRDRDHEQEQKGQKQQQYTVYLRDLRSMAASVQLSFCQRLGLVDMARKQEKEEKLEKAEKKKSRSSRKSGGGGRYPKLAREWTEMSRDNRQWRTLWTLVELKPSFAIHSQESRRTLGRPLVPLLPAETCYASTQAQTQTGGADAYADYADYIKSYAHAYAYPSVITGPEPEPEPEPAPPVPALAPTPAPVFATAASAAEPEPKPETDMCHSDADADAAGA